MLAGDSQIQARAQRVERLLRIVCGDTEFPLYVSDFATLYDVCSLTDEELLARLSSSYGSGVRGANLRDPVWKLVDSLDPEA